jgi:hypothetical protein
VHDIRCFNPLVQAVNVIESLDEAEIPLRIVRHAIVFLNILRALQRINKRSRCRRRRASGVAYWRGV